MEMIHPTHDPRHMQVVVLDGDDFTIEEVVAVARYHAKVEFAPEFIERVNKSRAISPALRSRQTNSLRKQLLTNHRFFHLSHGRGERQLGTASPPCSFKSPDFTTFNA